MSVIGTALPIQHTTMCCILSKYCKVLFSEPKVTIFVTLIMLLILALLSLSVYMIVRPIECLKSKSFLPFERSYEYKPRRNCREVPIDFFPRAVALIEKNTNIHVCGGVIISTGWILTAARCIDSCKDHHCPNYAIRVGSTYSNRDGWLHGIKSVVVHPSFNSFSLENDVGLIHTDMTNIVTKTEISSIIPSSGELYGWSSFSKVNTFYRDNILKIMDFDVVPIGLCNINLKGERTNFQLKADMICGVVTLEKGGCYVDPGSPLVSENSLVGIAIFGGLCYSCRSDMAAFTNVSAYKQFIQESMSIS